NPPVRIVRRAPTLELHEIQAAPLRPRPAPYFGTHVLLRVDGPATSIRWATRTALISRRSKATALTHCPGQGPLIKAGEIILRYAGEAGVPLPLPQPDILGRNGTY